jgi:probable F420-dependent oxidoreductase
VKLGVIVSPAAGWTYEELRVLANESERAGFESFWASDHFFGGEGFPDRDCLEAWTLLAALARDTKTIRLGCMVTAAQYRNPALLAKIVASVDQMSDGRVEFGVGAGWKENEYKAYGYSYDDAGARVEQLIDTLEICRRLWTEERATYEGKHYRVVDAVCAPKPKQKPHVPIWIGASKPRMMRIAARSADGFDISRQGANGAPLTGDEMRAAIAEIRGTCAAVKRERPLLLSNWASLDLESDGVAALRDRLTDYDAAGLDRFLFNFPKDRALEMVRRAGDVLSA